MIQEVHFHFSDQIKATDSARLDCLEAHHINRRNNKNKKVKERNDVQQT